MPAKVAAEITKRNKMLVISMGSGRDCDGQFIFAEDLLGSHSGPYPRHSITYAHLMEDAVAGLTQYREAVLSGAYPTAKHSIKIKADEFARFEEAIQDPVHAPAVPALLRPIAVCAVLAAAVAVGIALGRRK